MAEVILIHGIGQQRYTGAQLQARWLPALTAGLRAAGHPDLANRVSVGHDLTTRMAFYGDLFLTPDFQGADDNLEGLTPDQLSLALALADEWLTRAAQRDGHPDQRTAAAERAHGHQDQGPPQEIARALLNALSRLSWFAEPTMAFAQTYVAKSLRQVTAYLTDPDLARQIEARVTQHLGPETRVIIGHSLGSVVAYQVAANHLNEPLPLMATLGSPLGLRTVIYHRLRPQPPTFPALIHRWVNLADRNDLVAAEPDLSNQFTRNKPESATLESTPVDNTATPHDATSYLSHEEAGRPVAEALT